MPRSDLVLFVMSADRPFTESEVKFLRYIRQWGKKVVFVVNKVRRLVQKQSLPMMGLPVTDAAEAGCMLVVSAANLWLCIIIQTHF